MALVGPQQVYPSDPGNLLHGSSMWSALNAQDTPGRAQPHPPRPGYLQGGSLSLAAALPDHKARPGLGVEQDKRSPVTVSV